MEKKDTNPKDAIGVEKVQFTNIPVDVLTEIALGMTEGALKYGPFNWISKGVNSGVYIDGTLRHIFAWQGGEDIDPDSKVSHITKAITSLIVLRSAMLNNTWTDTRPPKSADNFIADANAKTKALIEKYRKVPLLSTA